MLRIKNQTHHFACTTENYDALYSRYLKNPEKLLEMAGYQTDHDLLDLCGSYDRKLCMRGN
jgi:hypothetical protein